LRRPAIITIALLDELKEISLRDYDGLTVAKNILFLHMEQQLKTS